MAHCHYCGEDACETWECFDCKQQTCEDCFAPMEHYATDPVTPCLGCKSDREHRHQIEADREAEAARKLQAQRDEWNRKAREFYWRPENVAKRRAEKEERKRAEAEAAAKRLREAVVIVRDWLR